MKRENEERNARCPFRRYRNVKIECKKEQAKIETMRNGVRGMKPGGKIRKKKNTREKKRSECIRDTKEEGYTCIRKSQKIWRGMKDKKDGSI